MMTSFTVRMSLMINGSARKTLFLGSHVCCVAVDVEESSRVAKKLVAERWLRPQLTLT
jgi:hypothetical protein